MKGVGRGLLLILLEIYEEYAESYAAFGL